MTKMEALAKQMGGDLSAALGGMKVGSARKAAPPPAPAPRHRRRPSRSTAKPRRLASLARLFRIRRPTYRSGSCTGAFVILRRSFGESPLGPSANAAASASPAVPLRRRSPTGVARCPSLLPNRCKGHRRPSNAAPQRSFHQPSSANGGPSRGLYLLRVTLTHMIGEDLPVDFPNPWFDADKPPGLRGLIAALIGQNARLQRRVRVHWAAEYLR